MSDTAVVLYGSPLISVEGRLDIINTTSNASISYIEQDGTNTAVRVCFTYVYEHCSSIGRSDIMYFS